MGTTIDSLDIQIKTEAGKSVAKIERLAKALENLSDNAKLDAVVNNLGRLKKALEGLPTVSKSFSKLPGPANEAASATNRLATATENASKSFDMSNMSLFAMIQNYGALIGAVNQAIQAVSSMLSQAIEWDGIQFRFGRAFAEDAEETYAYIQKINEALGINIQEFMQYSSLYGSLLSGFGMAQEKVTTISVGLTELSYDIWAAYNDRFKTLEDASEAVRSAITGEIEPIRNAGIALTEASLQEFIDSTHLAGVSIEKLTEAQKSEVRYAAMVNAAMNQGIVGTYAREMNTAEGAVRSLSQSFKGLVQALGSLFIPLLQVIVPYVTAFVEILTDAVFLVAELFGIPIQEINWGDSTKGVGGLADGAKDAASGLDSAADAAKKLKNYTMGFDELNVIDPNSGSGSGGKGGAGGGSGWGEGLDLDTLWDDTIFAQASKKVSELKEQILGFLDKWKTELAIIGTALGVLSISKLLSGLGQALFWGDKFLDTMNMITKIASSAIVITLQFALQKEFFTRFMSDDGSFWDYVASMLIGAGASWILYSMWGAGGLVIGLGVTAVASLSAIIENGGINDAESATVALTGLATAVGAVAIAWKKLVPVIMGSNLVQVLLGIKNGSSAANSALTFMFPTFFKIKGAITAAATAVGGFLAGITAPVWGIIAGVVAAIASAAYFLYKNWEEVTTAVKNFFKENIAPKLEEIGEHFSDIKEATGKFGEAMSNAWKTVKDFFAGIDWSKLEWIGKIFEVIGGIIFSVVGGVIATAFNILVGLIENTIQIFTGLSQIVSGVIQFLVALFTGDFSSILDIVLMITEGIQNLFDGMVGFIVDIVINFVEGVCSWFNTLSEELFGKTVPEMIDGIVEWFLSLPEKILGPVQQFVDDVLLTFKTLWANTKKWWAENVAPKFTSEYWLNKFDVIRAAIKTKLDEWKKAILDKWSDIKSWYNTNVAPKFTKTYWEGKFKGFKDGFVSVIKNAMNSGIDKINSFINRVNEALHIEWDAFSFRGKEIFPSGSFTLATIPTIARFENGGFIEDGLFTMNRGEIAGKFNNGKSVVANNEQIVAGIAEGVYSAVVAAMSETQRGNGEQPVVVYLDGKQIYSSVKRTESRRGVDLMGNQLGYVY